MSTPKEVAEYESNRRRRKFRKRLQALGGGGSATSYEAEAAALFARFTTPPATIRKGLINTFILGMKTAGLWAKMDLTYAEAAADAQAAQRNWLADAFNLVEAVPPTFVADRGYNGNAVDMELTTGYTPSINGVQLQRDSAHIGVFVLTAGASNNPDFGTVAGGSPLFVKARTGVNGQGRVNATAVTLTASAGGTVPLHMVAVRRDATNIFLFRNGVQVATVATASLALSASPFSIFRVSGTFSDRQVAITHAGAQLSDAEVLSMYNLSLAYLQGVGAA